MNGSRGNATPFLLDKSVNSLQRGLDAQRKNRAHEAKLHYLQAAELLFKAADLSPQPLKDVRVQRAEEALSLAQSVEEPEPQAAHGSPRKAVAEQEAAEASDWLLVERPDVKLSDVAGLEEPKEQIRMRMIYPFTHADQAKRLGMQKGGGVLLYGPPGTGKTLLARAVAGEIEAAFLTVDAAQIMSRWVGEAEQNVAKLFKEARRHPRCVILINWSISTPTLDDQWRA